MATRLRCRGAVIVVRQRVRTGSGESGSSTSRRRRGATGWRRCWTPRRRCHRCTKPFQRRAGWRAVWHRRDSDMPGFSDFAEVIDSRAPARDPQGAVAFRGAQGDRPCRRAVRPVHRRCALRGGRVDQRGGRRRPVAPGRPFIAGVLTEARSGRSRHPFPRFQTRVVVAILRGSADRLHRRTSLPAASSVFRTVVGTGRVLATIFGTRV